ncbi:energy transducer TonB [Lysobacter niabensis]|uniref:energy transducer TonB n=1 Tax=Agrilutibacter niabensis TaxID=380628 RepID=UPI003620F783
MGFRALMLAALAWPLLAVAGETGDSQLIDGNFKGWAEIDASGRLQSFAPDGKAHPAIAQALQQQLQGVAFKPARQGAGSVGIRTYLQGEYRLVMDGDSYVLQLKTFHAGPKPLTLDVPRVPLRALQLDEASWLRASFVIDRDGRAKDVLIEESGGSSELRRNVAKSMPYWRFEPESVAGTPIETAVRQEFLVYAASKPKPIPTPCPADASGRVLAPEQTSCRHRMEVSLGESQLGRDISIP